MDDKLIIYEKYANVMHRMAYIAGIWPGYSSKLSRLIMAVNLVPILSSLVFVIYFTISNISSIAHVTKGLAIIVGYGSMLIRISCLLLNRSSVMELHATLVKNFREGLKNPELRPILLLRVGFFSRAMLWIGLSTFGIPLLYITMPMVSVAIQRARGVSPIKYTLLLPAKYPWTITGNSLRYRVQYVIEAWGGVAVANGTGSGDALFSFYIYLMMTQLRALSHLMRNLQTNADNYTVMKECAIRYRDLARCRDLLQRAYGPVVIWIVTTSAITICANLYEVAQMSVGKAILSYEYMAMKLGQAFLYGWFGTVLTSESEDFLQAVYFSGWPGSGDETFMKNVRFMLSYKPLVLTACSFSIITLDMFSAVVNTALSYFFLLRTLEAA